VNAGCNMAYSPSSRTAAGEETEYGDAYLRKLTRRGRFLGEHRQWFFYAFLRRRFRKFRRDATLLDIGFGGGYLLRRFEKRFTTVGIDVSWANIEYAGRVCTNTRFARAAAEAIPLGDAVCDLIICKDLIEHIERPHEVFLEVTRVLKAGGLAFISTPNPNSAGARTKGEQWAGWRDKTHVGVRPADEWRAVIRAAGLSIDREGTDFLWDIPYPIRLPAIVQKVLFIPVTLFVWTLFGFLPWKFGENSCFILKKT